MRRITKVLLGAAVVLTTAAAVAVHEVTYLGTVSAVEEGRIQ